MSKHRAPGTTPLPRIVVVHHLVDSGDGSGVYVAEPYGPFATQGLRDAWVRAHQRAGTFDHGGTRARFEQRLVITPLMPNGDGGVVLHE